MSVDGKVLVTYDADRLVVPVPLRKRVLNALHSDSHGGITKMRVLARETVFWPGISKDILDLVNACPVCQEFQASLPKEPLQTQFALFPMEQIGTDLFQWHGKDFLATVDRFSGYIWCHKLRRTGTGDVTQALAEVFNSFGYPSTILSDNGPQFRGPFKDFCKTIGAEHHPSSPLSLIHI